MLSGMFTVSEDEAAAIRTAYEQRGELAAAVELRRLFPGVGNVDQARKCASIIAGWRPLPKHRSAWNNLEAPGEDVPPPTNSSLDPVTPDRGNGARPTSHRGAPRPPLVR